MHHIIRLLVVTFFLVFGTLVYGQQTAFTIQETESFKDTKRNTSFEELFTLSNGEMVAVRSGKRRLMVSTFSNAYEVSKDIEIDLERKQEFVGASQDDVSLHVFTITKVDKLTKYVTAYTYVSGAATLKSKKLYTVHKDEARISKFGSLVSKKHERIFRTSPDGNYLAFALENIDESTNSFSIRVFDKNLEQVYQTSYMESADNYYAFDDFIVTNNAEVLSAGKLYKKGRREKRGGKANYEYVVYRVTQEGADAHQFDMGDNFVKELKFAIAQPNIRLLGFYSEKNSNRMKGIVSYTFTNFDIKNVKTVEQPFPETLFQDIYSESRAKKLADKEKELRDYYLDHTLVDDAGNAYLLAEQFYITQSTIASGNGMFATNSTPHYDNILVVKFNQKGEVLWARSLFKSDNRPSYNAFVLDTTLHVLLNASKNLSERKDGRTKMKRTIFSSTALYDVTFNSENGDLTYTTLQENSDKVTYRPYLGSYRDNTIILPNVSKRNKSFLILTEK